MPSLADKIAMKVFVSSKVGEQHVVPTVKTYDRADDIDVHELEVPVILKATHGSGWNKIVRYIEESTNEQVRLYFAKWLSKNYYLYSKEWAYRAIPPRVVCEPRLVDDAGEVPNDYKVFCFAGEPHYVQVDHDRFSGHRRAFFDISWQRQDFSIGYPKSSKEIPRPERLDEMLFVSRELSEGFPFLRVDFLAHGQRTFVGELAFYPGNGMEQFSDKSWDRRLGDLVKLWSSYRRPRGAPSTTTHPLGTEGRVK